MAPKPVTLTFAGDSSDLTREFEKVGSGAKEMAGDIDQAAGQTRRSFNDLEGGIDGSQQKFRGLADAMNGSKDLMEGLSTGNIPMMAIGLADIAGGLVDFVIPAVKSFALALKTQLAGAMTFIMAHPMVAAIAAAGAIIVGLVLLEQKTGLVSKAFKAVGRFLSEAWNTIKPILAAMATALDKMLGPLDEVIGGIAKIGGGALKGIGGAIGGLNPFRHTGGTVPGHAGQNVMTVLQAGEMIVPRGSSAASGGGVTINVGGSVITERDLGRIVADALRQNKLIGVTV